MKRILPVAVIVAVFISMIFIGYKVSAVSASDWYERADLKSGGLLYDKWFKLTGSKPEGTHPAYPAEGKQSGDSTWRCKECHGWDYVGKDGRYGSGSHFTGIPGLLDSRNKEPEALYSALSGTGSPHDFSKEINEDFRWALVKFIKEGQMDMRPYLDKSGQAKGSVTAGQALYGKNCEKCHGADGNAIDFNGKKEGLQGVGFLTNDNPQESLHKIRWGHPGSEMPSMVTDAGLSDQETVDILAYSQTLK